jgi:O-antigen/teichoic acid export membrane protein
VLTFITALLFIHSKAMRLSITAIRISEIKKIGVACLPFALIYLFSSMYNKLDVILIGKLLESGNQQSGIYAASMRLFEACSMISLAFGSLLLAMFSTLYKDRSAISGLFLLAWKSLLVITIGIVCISIFYSQEIMILLYHQTDPYWSRIFLLTMIAFIPASLNYISGAFLAAVHEEKRLYIFYLIATLISGTMNLIMILQWQVTGAALTAILTHTVLFVMQLWYIQKKALVEWQASFAQRCIAFSSLALSLSWLISQFEMYWIIKIAITGFIIFLIAVIMNMISVKQFISMYRLRNQNE